MATLQDQKGTSEVSKHLQVHCSHSFSWIILARGLGGVEEEKEDH